MTTSTTQPEIFSRDHTLSEEEDTPDIGIEDMQSEEHESEEGFEEEPPYSAQELGEMFTDFYRFLATLHYDPQNLKVPPPEGWNITDLPPSVVEKKSELMVKVMRHLPYFSNARKSTQVDLQCILIDYIDAEQHERAAYHQEIAFDGLGDDGFSAADAILYSTFLRAWQKEKYRSLEILVCPGREVWLATTSKAHEVSAREERGGPITEKEVRAQEEDWGTELDELFVKLMWRQYGWPEAFRREEAVEAMEAFMAFHTKRRYGWQEAHQ
ncbi:unnamed protein product [Zymoseptoria tritici ST99CH_1E4]|nr:unnamed protein product [Zymoseptoria tritici ST99CH_1E4]